MDGRWLLVPLPLPWLDLLDLQKLELDLLLLLVMDLLDLLDLLLDLLESLLDLLESLLDVPLDFLLDLLLDLPLDFLLDFSGLQVSTPCPEEMRKSLEQPQLLPHHLTSWSGVLYRVEQIFGRLQVWLLQNFRWLASQIFQVEAVHQQGLADLFSWRADGGLHFHGEILQIPWRIAVVRVANL